MRLFILIACCLTLGACSSTRLELPPMPVSAQCPKLPLLSDAADMGEMATSDVAISGLYAECAALNAGWVRWAGDARELMK